VDDQHDIPVLKTVKIKLQNGADFLTYYFHENSLGGILIPGRVDLELGQEISLDLYFLEENRVFHIRGTVKWRRLKNQTELPAGAGVEFPESERKARDVLLEFANGRNIVIQRRRSTRLPALLEVEYATDSVFLTDATDNLSDGGAFLLTKDPPPVGSIIKLKLRPPGYRSGITLNAEVVWCRKEGESGVGVRFIFPWYKSAHKLNKLIERIRIQIGLQDSR
jgi:uncharacterized protein (TIGR02266 family)